MLRGDENAAPHNSKKVEKSDVVTKLCANFEVKTPKTQDLQAKKTEGRTPKAGVAEERKSFREEAERGSASTESLSITPSHATTNSPSSRQPFKRIHTEDAVSSTSSSALAKDNKASQSTKKAKVKSLGEKRDSSPLRTCIRFKPQGFDEHLDASDRSANIQDRTVVMKSLDKKDTIRYTFDEVFAEHVTQEDMFERAARKLTDDFLDGYNATIFAYGQTGSGKTHTMLGDLNLRSASRGITPRVFVHVFAELAARQSDFELKVSFLQIYNEKCQDLLNPAVNTKIGHVEEDLKIRESTDGGVFVEGLSKVACKTAEQALDCVVKGIRNRKTGKTAMNTESSRSHSILTLELTDKKYTSRLNLIDLAGSENQKTSTASSALQQNEANNINLSLTYLGQCLRDTVKGGGVVNYRNSKLTKLLKDSLGGTAKTCVIATVSALPAFAFETASTLKFASTIKLIQTHAVRNPIKGASDSLEAEVARLQLELRTQAEEAQAKYDAQAIRYEAKLKAAATATPHPSTFASFFEDSAFSNSSSSSSSSSVRSRSSSNVDSARRIAELEATVRNLEIEIAEMIQSKHQDAEDFAAQLKAKETNNAQDNHFTAEMEEMKNAYDSLKRQMNNRVNKPQEQDISQALQTSQRTIDELQLALQTVQAEKDALKEDLAFMFEQTKGTTGGDVHTIRRLTERATTASSAETVAALQTEVLLLQETSQKDLAKIDELRTLVQELEEKKGKDAQRIEQLEAEVRQLRRGPVQSEHHDTGKDSGKIEELRKLVHQLQDSVEGHEKGAKQLKADLDAKVAELEAKTAELTQQRERCHKYNNQLTKMRCERQRTANLEFEHQQCKTTLTKIQSENQTLHRRVSELQQHLSQERNDQDELARMALDSEGEKHRAKLDKLEVEFGGKLPLHNQTRLFIREGLLKRVSTQKKLLEYNFFLFTDVLIYASPSKTATQCKYKAHRVLHLGLCRLVDIQPRPESEADTLYSNSFRLITPQKGDEKDTLGFYISCDTPQEKQNWMTAIRIQIEKVYSQPEDTCTWVQVPRVADVSAPERVPDVPANAHDGFSTRSSFSVNEDDRKEMMRSRESSVDYEEPNFPDVPSEAGEGLSWALDDPNRPRAPSGDSVVSRSRAGSVSSSIFSRITEFSEMDLPKSDTAKLRAKVQANDYCRLCVRPFTHLQLSSRQKTKCGCCEDENVCRGCCSNKAVPPRSLDGKECKVCLACYGGIKGLIGRGLPRLSVQYE